MPRARPSGPRLVDDDRDPLSLELGLGAIEFLHELGVLRLTGSFLLLPRHSVEPEDEPSPWAKTSSGRGDEI